MIVGSLNEGVKLNLIALVDSNGFDAERLAQRSEAFRTTGLRLATFTELKRLFEHACDLRLADPSSGRNWLRSCRC